MNKLALDKNLLKALARSDVQPEPARTIVHECYLNDQTTIQRFHRHLSIGPIYGKWKNGIPLWPSVKSSVVPYRCQESLALDAIIENLLRGNIIKTARRGPFVSNIFLVQKSNGQSRPIVDFSHLTPYLKVPKMVLPSLHQLVRKKTWSKNLWYAKFDFASAFFNVDLKEASKYITCFKYRDKYYVFNRLSMGLSIAPFVMQRFTNTIVRYIRQFTTMTWGHIDDVLVAHEDPEYLKEIVEKCLIMFEKIGWRLNLTKSVLIPVKSITFLGSTWGAEGVSRLPLVTKMCHQVIRTIVNTQLALKPLQKIRGYLNYYLSFAGNFHSVINRNLLDSHRLKCVHVMRWLVKEDFVSFYKPVLTETATYWSDATLTQVAFTDCATTIKEVFFLLFLLLQVSIRTLVLL